MSLWENIFNRLTQVSASKTKKSNYLEYYVINSWSKNIFSPTLPFITYLISYFTYSHTGSQRLLFTKITVKI